MMRKKYKIGEKPKLQNGKCRSAIFAHVQRGSSGLAENRERGGKGGGERYGASGGEANYSVEMPSKQCLRLKIL